MALDSVRKDSGASLHDRKKSDYKEKSNTISLPDGYAIDEIQEFMARHGLIDLLPKLIANNTFLQQYPLLHQLPAFWDWVRQAPSASQKLDGRFNEELYYTWENFYKNWRLAQILLQLKEQLQEYYNKNIGRDREKLVDQLLNFEIHMGGRCLENWHALTTLLASIHAQSLQNDDQHWTYRQSFSRLRAMLAQTQKDCFKLKAKLDFVDEQRQCSSPADATNPIIPASQALSQNVSHQPTPAVKHFATPSLLKKITGQLNQYRSPWSLHNPWPIGNYRMGHLEGLLSSPPSEKKQITNMSAAQINALYTRLCLTQQDSHLADLQHNATSFLKRNRISRRLHNTCEKMKQLLETHCQAHPTFHQGLSSNRQQTAEDMLLKTLAFYLEKKILHYLSNAIRKPNTKRQALANRLLGFAAQLKNNKNLRADTTKNHLFELMTILNTLNQESLSDDLKNDQRISGSHLRDLIQKTKCKIILEAQRMRLPNYKTWIRAEKSARLHQQAHICQYLANPHQREKLQAHYQSCNETQIIFLTNLNQGNKLIAKLEEQVETDPIYILRKTLIQLYIALEKQVTSWACRYSETSKIHIQGVLTQIEQLLQTPHLSCDAWRPALEIINHALELSFARQDQAKCEHPNRLQRKRATMAFTRAETNLCQTCLKFKNKLWQQLNVNLGRENSFLHYARYLAHKTETNMREILGKSPAWAQQQYQQKIQPLTKYSLFQTYLGCVKTRNEALAAATPIEAAHRNPSAQVKTKAQEQPISIPAEQDIFASPITFITKKEILREMGVLQEGSPHYLLQTKSLDFFIQYEDLLRKIAVVFKDEKHNWQNCYQELSESLDAYIAQQLTATPQPLFLSMQRKRLGKIQHNVLQILQNLTEKAANTKTQFDFTPNDWEIIHAFQAFQAQASVPTAPEDPSTPAAPPLGVGAAKRKFEQEPIPIDALDHSSHPIGYSQLFEQTQLEKDIGLNQNFLDPLFTAVLPSNELIQQYDSIGALLTPKLPTDLDTEYPVSDYARTAQFRLGALYWWYDQYQKMFPDSALLLRVKKVLDEQNRKKLQGYLQAQTLAMTVEDLLKKCHSANLDVSHPTQATIALIEELVVWLGHNHNNRDQLLFQKIYNNFISIHININNLPGDAFLDLPINFSSTPNHPTYWGLLFFQWAKKLLATIGATFPDEGKNIKQLLRELEQCATAYHCKKNLCADNPEPEKQPTFFANFSSFLRTIAEQLTLQAESLTPQAWEISKFISQLCPTPDPLTVQIHAVSPAQDIDARFEREIAAPAGWIQEIKTLFQPMVTQGKKYDEVWDWIAISQSSIGHLEKPLTDITPAGERKTPATLEELQLIWARLQVWRLQHATETHSHLWQRVNAELQRVQKIAPANLKHSLQIGEILFRCERDFFSESSSQSLEEHAKTVANRTDSFNDLRRWVKHNEKTYHLRLKPKQLSDLEPHKIYLEMLKPGMLHFSILLEDSTIATGDIPLCNHPEITAPLKLHQIAPLFSYILNITAEAGYICDINSPLYHYASKKLDSIMDKYRSFTRNIVVLDSPEFTPSSKHPQDAEGKTEVDNLDTLQIADAAVESGYQTACSARRLRRNADLFKLRADDFDTDIDLLGRVSPTAKI